MKTIKLKFVYSDLKIRSGAQNIFLGTSAAYTNPTSFDKRISTINKNKLINF